MFVHEVRMFQKYVKSIRLRPWRSDLTLGGWFQKYVKSIRLRPLVVTLVA